MTLYACGRIGISIYISSYQQEIDVFALIFLSLDNKGDQETGVPISFLFIQLYETIGTWVKMGGKHREKACVKSMCL